MKEIDFDKCFMGFFVDYSEKNMVVIFLMFLVGDDVIYYNVCLYKYMYFFVEVEEYDLGRFVLYVII